MSIATPTDRQLPLCVADYASPARAALAPEVWDWLAGGAERERTLAANRAAFERLAVVPRVLADVSACDTATTLVRSRSALPVAVAPIAYHRLFHPEGELASARAAAAAGVPFTVGTLSSVGFDELAATGATLWFQLYWLRDRARLLDLVAAAEAAGSECLVVTADVPYMGRRLRDARNAFALPGDVRAALLEDGAAGRAHRATADVSAVAAHTAELLSPAVTWADLGWLGRHTRLPLVVKGVLDPADALRAADLGAAAVVVSNHGGRQLDRAVPSLTALPAVADALAGRDCQVLLDSGVRGGSDVLAALALGASGVLLGRPAIWGLAADGEAGCTRVLELLSAELRHALGLAGCADLAAATTLRTTPLPCPAWSAP
ncbi:alpha-hydroxy acid oxidase [Streptomyces sp. CBMA123]|uniref:alpha-hydroxy acid oxidase n=1 Tax=Streptomyces sp. CBMA123 TaxID=1896313 RepID=UPI001661FA3B|nr:alpha-hydroxy acid oxidase [Streptomyces sp. CBMA123]MBD0694497.1 alpha-hydroxy-acid oxidizing enzyme [Streptomyces sp. CBMA123]